MKPETAGKAPASIEGATPSAVPEKAVCRCFSVGESQIIRVIKKGATSIEEIAEATGATRGCGGCTCDVEKIMKCEIGKK
jgi:NAD(P)H-nitrite reductase large subunit